MPAVILINPKYDYNVAGIEEITTVVTGERNR
jgi:hypothetical protein